MKGARGVVPAVCKAHTPIHQGGIGPVCTLVGMALIAGIRRASAHGQIRSRDAHAVIPPRIDPHVELARHVAAHAGAPGRRERVPVVFGVIVGAGQMTLGTDAVAFDHQLVAVWVMAVGAGHAGLMHLALNERTVDVYLVADLSIGPVKRLLNDSQAVGIEQRLARVVLAQGTAPGVASRTAINLVVGGQRFSALRDISALGPLPCASRLEAHRKSGLGRRQASRIGEGDVFTARPVTGLTAHIDLLVVGIELVVHRVVAFFDVGAVTFRAAGIPVKESARPMQRVTGCNVLVGVEVVPTLPALALGPGIPGDRECLQATVTKGQ